MTLFVVGHGSRDAREGDTFVPAGMTVHFFTKFDEDLLHVNLQAVLAGHVRRSADSYDQSRPIPNYRLSPQETELLVADLTVIVDPENLVPVPRTMKLCGKPVDCAAAGEHKCAGLFGVLPFDPEVFLLVCRGRTGLTGVTKLLNKSKTGDKLPGERRPEHLQRMSSMVRELLALSKKDDHRAARYFDGLSTEDQAMLIGGYPAVQKWTYIRTAKEYLAQHRFLAYYRYYLCQDPAWQTVFDSDNTLREAADQARKYVEWFVNATQQQREAARGQMSETDVENLRYLDERVHALLGYRVDNTHVRPEDMVKLVKARARARNAELLSALGENWVRFQAAGTLLAVGDGHDIEVLQVLASAHDYFPYALPLTEGAMHLVNGHIEAAWSNADDSSGSELVEQEMALMGWPAPTWVPWAAELSRQA